MKDEEGAKNVLARLGILLGFPILIAAAYVLNGWVASVLWAWFISPTFKVNPITIAQAIGISIVIGALHPSTYQEEKDKPWWTPLVKIIGAPLITLLVGWVVHLFM